MDSLRVSLFGQFCIVYEQQALASCNAGKLQELLSYLLLHPDRPHAREVLASLLWGDGHTTCQSKAYLRKALWQLLAVLENLSEDFSHRLLQVGPVWIQLNSTTELWLDVAVFKEVYTSVKGVPGTSLDLEQVSALEAAVNLYRGDLLENWYHEWCLYEREWLFQVYLILLNKLMDYYVARGAYEAGLDYGERILRHDCAQERTHRHLMQLRYLAGDRTGSLRQYERCVVALREELDVEPAESTVRIYEQIREGHLEGVPARLLQPGRALGARGLVLPEAIDHLRQLQIDLMNMQQHVQQAIDAVDQAHTHQH